MTIKHLFPLAFPKLDLNFAAERSLDPRITFTRSSIGTYVDATGILRTAAEDEPRFDHSGTGKSLGLLIEESRTNAITYSFDLGNTGTGGWYTDANKGGLNGSGGKNYFVTQSNTTDTLAPDGTYTATKLSAPSTIKKPKPDPTIDEDSAIHLISKVQPSAGASSFYIKDPSNFANGLNKIGIMSGGTYNSAKGFATFDLVNNQVSTRNSASDAKIEAVGNGWYRISCVTGQGGCWGFNAWNGLTSDLYIWGAQQEAGGSFATSYIATNGAAEDRAADFCSIEGDNFSSWYNQSEGTVIVDFISDYDAGSNTPAASISDGGTSQRISLRPRNTIYGSKGVANLTVNETPPNVPDKVAWSFDSSGLSLISGSANDLYDSPLASQTLTQLYIGQYSPIASRDRIGGTIARLSYYPRRLSDEQLQALTS